MALKYLSATIYPCKPEPDFAGRWCMVVHACMERATVHGIDSRWWIHLGLLLHGELESDDHTRKVHGQTCMTHSLIIIVFFMKGGDKPQGRVYRSRCGLKLIPLTYPQRRRKSYQTHTRHCMEEACNGVLYIDVGTRLGMIQRERQL